MRSPTTSAISCGLGDAGADQGLVIDELEGEAGQDRREGGEARTLHIFQMAEVAIARQMFQEILWLIAELRPQPPPASMKRFTRSSAIDRSVQMPVKIAGSAPRPSFGLPELLVAIHTSRSVLLQGRKKREYSR
jgi:hypothetical protein